MGRWDGISLSSCRPVVAWRCGWQVDVVINYDLPTSSKDYVHRVGRTGESKRLETAVLLRRRACHVPANASGFDTHRDSITSRCDCSFFGFKAKHPRNVYCEQLHAEVPNLSGDVGASLMSEQRDEVGAGSSIAAATSSEAAPLTEA